MMRMLRDLARIGLAGVFLVGSPTPGDEPDTPRVVIAWAGGLMEVRVAFDRPVAPEVARGVVGREIAFGEGEKPGEIGRAGGDRGTLRVAAARLADEGRTLVLVTDPHPRESTYRLDLPGVKAAGVSGPGSTRAVSYDLGGVEIALDQDGRKSVGWWPLLDPNEARKIMAGSAEAQGLKPQTPKKSELTLQTLIRTRTGNVRLELEASSAFEVTLGTESARSNAAKPGVQTAMVTAESTGEPMFLSILFPDVPSVPASIRATIDGAPIARSAFVLPWAPSGPPTATLATLPPALLTGGNPARGEAVFYGEQSKCANCHQVRGKGGIVGPDLTSLAGRDRAWVYRNIMEPSASIHPNYVSYTVARKDGRIAMGVVRAEGADAVKVSDIDARQTIIPRAEIEEIRPSSSSIMPVGLLGAIGEDATRDLLAYLTGPPK